MDGQLRKLGLFLTCLFSLFFLALLAEILYVFLYRRHVIHFLRRFKRQPSGRVDSTVDADQMTRVSGSSESTLAVAEEDVMKMHAYAACRQLFTIQEEDKEGPDYSSERSVEIGQREQLQNRCDDQTASLELETPCDSPMAFFTPSASPYG